MIAILALAGAVWGHQQPTIEQIDRLAQARDYEGLSRLVTVLPNPNPLMTLKSNGAYECGRFGWRANEMDSPEGGSRYVAVSTPLTTEDIGDFLFRREGSSLVYVPEDDSMGAHVVGHSFDVTFDPVHNSVAITDQLTVEPTHAGDFVLRMSKEFRIGSIVNGKGEKVPFSQGGGIILLHAKQAGKTTLKLFYIGTVDHPLYSGSISTKEATLTNDYWYPMIARQPAPYEVTVHYPTDWIAVGQGVKVSEAPGVSHFRMDLPCVFYSLSAGPYKTGTFKDGDLTFYAWSPRDSVATLQTQAETYASIVKFYSRFGAFPFKSYGGLDSPGYGGGALEAYSYATYGGGFPEVDAHEPSHTWWGGIVDNTYLHSFWNESCAVFSENFYRREWANNDAGRLAFIPVGEVGQGADDVACADGSAFVGPIANELGYGKGSHVLLMLEKLIGTDAMVRSLKRFAASVPRGTPAEWSDFEKAAIAENPDRNLKIFFDDWIHRPGHLEMNASVSYASGAIKIAYQPTAKAYRIPLEVLLQYPDGKTLDRIFDVRDRQEISIPSPSKPSVVSVDPYRFLLRHVADNESPEGIVNSKTGLQPFVDPAHKDWAQGIDSAVSSFPDDPANWLIVGSPETVPQMASLCAHAGFDIKLGKLTYKGVTVDLSHGGAQAVVDLPSGKTCEIRLGKTRIQADVGTSKVAVYDDLGRFLTGETLPKTKGNLTFQP